MSKLLRIPVDYYNNILTLLNIINYGPVLSAFDYRGRTHTCAYIITNALEHSTLVPTSEQADSLFNLLETLIKSEPNQPDNVSDSEDFAEEQTLIARLINLMKNDNPDQQYLVTFF